MADTVNRILETEKLATDIVAAARQKQLEQLENMRVNVEKIRKAELAKAYTEISDSRNNRKLEFKSRDDALEEDFTDKTDRLTSIYNDNRDTWVSEIYDNILRFSETED